MHLDEQLDRALVKQLRPGKTIPLKRLESFSRTVVRKLDRKLLRHGWGLRKLENGDVQIRVTN